MLLNKKKLELAVYLNLFFKRTYECKTDGIDKKHEIQ